MSSNTSKVIVLARKNVGNGAAMDSSARLCLEDAVRLQDLGNAGSTSDLAYARERAIKALGYSVGIFHEDYKAAVQLHEASR
jgi:hypothetical protein